MRSSNVSTISGPTLLWKSQINLGQAANQRTSPDQPITITPSKGSATAWGVGLSNEYGITWNPDICCAKCQKCSLWPELLWQCLFTLMGVKGVKGCQRVYKVHILKHWELLILPPPVSVHKLCQVQKRWPPPAQRAACRHSVPSAQSFQSASHRLCAPGAMVHSRNTLIFWNPSRLSAYCNSRLTLSYVFSWKLLNEEVRMIQWYPAREVYT